jgi:transposase
MDVIFPACAGLDVHKKTVVACCITPGRGREPQRETRTFATMTDDLLALSDWLTHQGVTHVAMESTGEFWKPVYNLLEGSFTLLLVNAAHVTNVPGRKTDVGDAAWLADLLRHGLVRASFIPPLAQRDLRDLTRQRTNLVQERAQVVNHLQKVLEWANLKLAAVASDVTGVSARAMLRALVEGQTNPTLLAELAKGPLRRKRADLARALTGRVRAHHQFLLAQHLTHLDFLEEQIACFDEQIRTHLATALGSSPEPGPPPEREGPEPPAPTVGPIAGPQAVALLDTIPGVGEQIAQVIVAEIGTDMTCFGSPRSLARWARVAPGNHESAGKRLSGRIGNGNRALRSALVQAAHAAVKVKDSYLAQVYRRLVGRRGVKRALIAVAHRILHAAYHILANHEPYQDYSPPPRPTRSPNVDDLAHRIELLGFTVILQPLAPEAA